VIPGSLTYLRARLPHDAACRLMDGCEKGGQTFPVCLAAALTGSEIGAT